MSELFQNKYRIASTRLLEWNYASEGSYFITICTRNKEYHFGDITDAKMILSEIGEVAKKEWLKTPDLRKDMNLELGEFVVMPNHFHAIINIGENLFNVQELPGRDAKHPELSGDAKHRVSTGNHFGPQSKNLASIIRGFKSAVTTHARQNNLPFAWQTRFHDHLIRSANEHYAISNYIINNPTKWQEDQFYKA